MTQAKGSFTPGPWRTGGSYLHHSSSPNGMAILSGDFIVVRMPAKADRPTNQKAADARLIAAAPALLEALKGARQTILDLKNSRWSEAEGSDEDWVGDIDAAIQSATGEG